MWQKALPGTGFLASTAPFTTRSGSRTSAIERAFDGVIFADNDNDDNVDVTENGFIKFSVAKTSKRIEEMCAVCIAKFFRGQTLSPLPCKHVFHQICID